MEQQIATGLPWGLVPTEGATPKRLWWWGPGIAVPPLLNREFRHGPSGTDGKGDCYALVKDWYLLERGVELQEGPRDWEWWLNGDDLYRQNFAGAGFRVADLAELREGDVLLMHVMSQTPNHAAIYLGGGLILHHLQGRLSRTEPAGRWLSYVTHALRHESAE
jgi:cell wall-associated NlpC family hydrolase